MKFIKKFIGKIIWNLSEFINIDLGKFAPICFAWMIGAKGFKMVEEDCKWHR